MVYIVVAYLVSGFTAMYISNKTKTSESLWSAVEKKVPTGYHLSLFIAGFTIFNLIVTMLIHFQSGTANEILKGVSMGIGMSFVPPPRENNTDEKKFI